MMKSTCLIALTFLSAATLSFAQIKTPAPSPTGKISQDVGLIKIDVEYSRPSIKGRKVFGELVPFGQMWRTGANATTKVTFSDDAQAGNISLKKGTYALFSIPEPTEWTIIFYKNITGPMPAPKDFKEEDVAGRLSVPVQAMKDKMETFTINIGNLRNNGADLELMWENTKVIVPIKVDTDAKVMADINATFFEGPNSNAYYAAARYYFDEKKDIKQALEWVNKAIEKGYERYWVMRLKADILAELKMYNEAVAAAERSSELAKNDGNMDMVSQNEKLIKEWKAKK